MSLFKRSFLCAVLFLSVSVSHIIAAEPSDNVSLAQGIMLGELTDRSVIVQTRTTQSGVVDGDVPGESAHIQFVIIDSEKDRQFAVSPVIETTEENDFQAQYKFSKLQPATSYELRVQQVSPDENEAETENLITVSFETFGGPDVAEPISFVIVSGMNYEKFYDGPKFKGNKAYDKADRDLGFPALKTMREMNPSFFIGTGDNVYYDTDKQDTATDARQMRQKWHEQFVQPRMRELFSEVPVYWMKDDHDHRYNDNDNTGDRKPSSELGIRIFKEQVPVVDPNSSDSKTYRTHRLSRDLQLWFVEGRDYRSPNKAPDNEEKTIWGAEQKEWLKRTLLESDATFKLLITPTPMVGPDDAHKRDNHTNLGGFRTEGNAFFSWLQEHDFDQKGFYILCGDRHWQYHAIHPSGFEEFSCGALVDNNARLGVAPGAKRGTDPEGLIQQPFTSPEPTGGFLRTVLQPGLTSADSFLRFEYYDELGHLLYFVEKPAPNSSEE